MASLTVHPASIQDFNDVLTGKAPSATVKVTDDSNFIGRVIHLLCRLRDHIERVDNGAVYAVDDLAVVLRAFVAKGPGNDVLGRLQDHAGGDQLSVLLSAPPKKGPATFAVGSIPTMNRHAVVDGAVRVSLRDFSKVPLLTIRLNDATVDFTWGEFLNKYANKWGGAHLDPVVPPELQIVDTFGTAGLSLSGYLLRSAAVVVWSTAQMLLARVMWGGGAPVSPGVGRPIVGTVGSLNSDPRDISGRGALQWFYWDTRELDFLWYVDPSAKESHVRFQTGQSWTISFVGQEGKAPTTAPRFQEPRGLSGVFVIEPAQLNTNISFQVPDDYRLGGQIAYYPQSADPRRPQDILRPWDR